jgi:hypothetical protein
MEKGRGEGGAHREATTAVRSRPNLMVSRVHQPWWLATRVRGRTRRCWGPSGGSGADERRGEAGSQRLLFFSFAAVEGEKRMGRGGSV